MSGIIKPPVGAQLNLSHPLARGLVGCWLMNEGSGKNVHDYSGQGNEGTIVGMNDPPIATSGWNAGPHGGALAFDGGDDYVLGNPMTLDDFTVIVYAHAKTGTESYYLSLGYNLPNSFLFHRSGTGFYAYYPRKASGGGTISTEVALRSNVSEQVAYTRAGNKIAFFLDGIGKYSRANDDQLFTITQNIEIGYAVARNNVTAYFNGLISFVSIYNRALSTEEIAYSYAFPFCMFDESAYPAWMRKHISAQDYYRNLLAGGF